MQAIPPFDALEVREQSAGRRKPAERRFLESERVMQKAAGPARVDDERRRHAHGRAIAPRAFEDGDIAFVTDVIQPRLVEIHRAGRFRLARQHLVERRPIPVRVGDFVMRARGHEQLPRASAIAIAIAFAIVRRMARRDDGRRT